MTSLHTLAVILARGGSKRLPNKNIMDLAGKPLIAYAIEAALKSKLINAVLVSTDCPQIQKVATDHGALAPFLRPTELASDVATSEDALKHAVESYEKIYQKTVEIVTLIQPTSPFTSFETINEAINHLLDNNFASVITVQVTPKRCEWIGQIDDDNKFRPIINKSDFPNIEKRPQYVPSGNVYVMKRKTLYQQKSIVGDNTGVIIVSNEEAVDIDYKIDFDFAEFLIKHTS